jgi:hypothetical protein
MQCYQSCVHYLLYETFSSWYYARHFLLGKGGFLFIDWWISGLVAEQWGKHLFHMCVCLASPWERTLWPSSFATMWVEGQKEKGREVGDNGGSRKTGTIRRSVVTDGSHLGDLEGIQESML